MKLNFQELDDYLLAYHDKALAFICPGGKIQGKEYTAGSIHGGPGSSFKFNIESGKWSDFADGSSGLGFIALNALVKSTGQKESFLELENIFRPDYNYIKTATPELPKTVEAWGIPPEEHELPKFYVKDATYTHHWLYKTIDNKPLLYVARFSKKDGSKEFRPYVWWDGFWKPKAIPNNRPLFGLESLGQNPERPVLIVEGEKTAEAAREFAGRTYNVLTWSGGANAVKKTDWSPIHGRHVLIWPDNDEAGQNAAKQIIPIISAHCLSVKLIEVWKNNQDLPQGWDAADSNFSYQDFVAFAKPLLVICPKQILSDKEKHVARDGIGVPQISNSSRAKHAIWTELGDTSGKEPPSNLDTALRVLEKSPPHADFIWYDSFYHKIFIRPTNGEPRPIQDQDEIALLAYMQRSLELSKIKQEHVRSAIMLHAHSNVKNEPQDWVKSLAWDGKHRISTFFSDYMGAEESLYTTQVSQNFWVGLMARIMEPGSKVDNMVILEGGQGRGKTTTLEILGGKWYVESAEKMGSKDFYDKLQGRLIVEIGELDSFSRADVKTVKQVVTQRVDAYRPAYGRNTKDFPRGCIFVGTTNKDKYLKDPTGARRFWPIRTDKIDLDDIIRDRDQFFAEAYELYKQGCKWHEIDSLYAQANQEDRRQEDPWEEVIQDYLIGKESTTVLDLLLGCLFLEKARMTTGDMQRVANCLKVIGWVKSKRTMIAGERIVKWVRAQSTQA